MYFSGVVLSSGRSYLQRMGSIDLCLVRSGGSQVVMDPSHP